MRRLLIGLSLLLLVLTSVAVGLLAADWPFWNRAWRWQMAPLGMPAELPGAARILGTKPARPFAEPAAQMQLAASRAAALHELAAQPATQALLVAQHDALVFEQYGAGTGPGQLLQGDTLSSAWLAPLYGIAEADGLVGLLDEILAARLTEWQDDARGRITSRQLFWHVSGLEAPAFRPLNPVSDRARLASGPNFTRAALGFDAQFPPGGFYRESPVDVQLLALVLQRSIAGDLADYLQARLWEPLGAGPARLTLDRRGGSPAAHCCFAATARDWLRLAMLLANNGMVAGERVLPARHIAEMMRQSPVHPGAGLGLSIEAGSGTRLLVMEAPGRMLIAVPSRGLAIAWFNAGPIDPQARVALLAALGL